MQNWEVTQRIKNILKAFHHQESGSEFSDTFLKKFGFYTLHLEICMLLKVRITFVLFCLVFLTQLSSLLFLRKYSVFLSTI